MSYKHYRISSVIVVISHKPFSFGSAVAGASAAAIVGLIAVEVGAAALGAVVASAAGRGCFYNGLGYDVPGKMP